MAKGGNFIDRHKATCLCPVCSIRRMGKTCKLLVAFPLEQYEYLQGYSQKYGISMSEVIRYGVKVLQDQTRKQQVIQEVQK